MVHTTFGKIFCSLRFLGHFGHIFLLDLFLIGHPHPGRGSRLSIRERAKKLIKGGSMRKDQIISLFIIVLFLFCLSCTKPLQDKGVTILSPKSNEVLKAGETYEI